MKYLTKEEFKANAMAQGAGKNNNNWSNWERRWAYHAAALSIVKDLGLTSETDVLEVGTFGASIVSGSDTMDFNEKWNMKGKDPTIEWDARHIPWPIQNGAYELLVALRVYHHLFPVQREALHEALRIANRVLIVVPDKTVKSGTAIAVPTITQWCSGIEPDVCERLDMGNLLFWDAATVNAIRDKVQLV